MNRAGPRWPRLLTAALAGVLVVELMPAGPDAGGLTPATRTIIHGPGAGMIDLAELGDWTAAIEARPLFASSRRPAPAIAGANDMPMPRLSAIIVARSEALAIFAGAPDGKPIVVRTGDTVGGYVLESIAPGEVTVAGPAGSRQLRPAFDTAPVAAAAAPKQVAAAGPRLPVEGSRQTLLDRVLDLPQPAR